jgi:hypothetical protein
VFANWSDGGALSHTITASSSPATYTANFTTQYYLTTAASPTGGGTISPASGWYNSGTVVSVSATANSGYQFSGFSGALSGTTTPQNLTMNAPKSVTANFGGVQHTITSVPAGRSLTVDGAGCTSPCTYFWTAGTNHTIATSTPQSGGTGTQYVFANWSDGGALSHSITAASSPATYTANFTTQYYLTTAATAGGTVSPASAWYNSGAVVSIAAIANSGYQFTGFTGDLTGTTTPQNLTMNAPKSVSASFADLTPPVISNVVQSGITSDGATITWSTDEASDTQVEYGTTTAYGYSSALNSSLVTSHAVTLAGLSASTAYYYRVRSRDAAGNLGLTAAGPFTTLAPANQPPSTTPVAPSGATGTPQSFTFGFGDPNGFADLTKVRVRVNSTSSDVGACSIEYSPATDTISLWNDAATGWAGSVVVAPGNSIQNGQCTVVAGYDSASGTSLNLNLTVTADASFIGDKTIYESARDAAGAESGWQAQGAWTPAAANSPCDPADPAVKLHKAVGVIRIGNNSVRLYADTWIDPNWYWRGYWLPRTRARPQYNTVYLDVQRTFLATSWDQHASLEWNYMLSQTGVGTYSISATHWANSGYCESFPGTVILSYDDSDTQTILRPARPDYSSAGGPVFFLGLGIPYDGVRTASTALVPGNANGATGTPQWSINVEGSTFGTLSCTNCSQPVFTATRKSTGCETYDVVIKTSYGGLESDPFYVFINAPHNTEAALDSEGQLWNYTYNYSDGYESRINYKVNSLCALDGPMSAYSVSESFGTWENDYPGGNNWVPGPAGGGPVPGDQWADVINFYSANCSFQPCVPLPQNPGPDFTPVHHVLQTWFVGSQTPGYGAKVQTNTLRRYTDQAEHENITTPVP